MKAIDFRFFIGCPCYVQGTERSLISTVEGVSASAVIVDGKTYHPEAVKLVLRSFDSLSRHEVEQLNKLWPNEPIKRTVEGSIQMDAEIINYLTLLHIDVFDWIYQGLAIDAGYNTIIK